MKANKLILIVASYMVFVLLMFHFSNNFKGLEEKLEQKEQKIELLQEENSLLHDEVFNLNQALMKELE